MRINDLFVLNEREINRIHSEIFKVLQNVGIKVFNVRALRLLYDAHCSVDFETRVVKIPEEVLQDTLSSIPRVVTLYGQNPEYDIRIGYGNKTYIVGASAARFIVDSDNERRIATLKDLRDTTRFYDYLDNCHIMQQAVVPSDISERKHDRVTFATLMANSVKHNWTWPEDPNSIEDHIAMASIILGNNQVKDKPIFSEGLCLMCPLQITDNVAEMLMTAAKSGIPLFIEVDPMMGATSPVTVAGTLVMQTATILGGIVIAQLINKGVPCISVFASGLMEMKSGNFAGATPEVTLSYIGAIQIARHYGLPIVVGSSIDSNFSDVQAGFEKVMQLLPLLSAKPDIIHLGVGMLEQMMLVSYAQGIIDNEVINACNRLVKGIDVTDETLAFNVISEVGHGGNYLSHPHTLELFKKELWIPDVSIREKREAWELRGGKKVHQIANNIAKDILKKHHPRPLSDSEERELFAMAESQQEKANF
jgi:trimethylamine---corrinoid protein Co-methyltransferase